MGSRPAKAPRTRGSIVAGSGKSGVHEEARAFQEAGGEIDVLYAPLADAPEDLEAALLQEHLHRAGLRPSWNRAVPKAHPSPAALAEAERLLVALRVGPR